MDTLLKLDQPDGCCPGQQAHHVIPKTKVEECAGHDPKNPYSKYITKGNSMKEYRYDESLIIF